MKKKTFFKILIINIFFILIIFFITEFSICAYHSYKSCIVYSVSKQIHTKKGKLALFKSILKKRLLEYTDIRSTYISNASFRPPSIINPPENNQNIVIAGCSFAYGHDLNYNETFAAVLSKYTHSNVYNIAVSGGSPRELLYMLRYPDLINQIIPKNKVQYFIYTYIGDHKRRLYSNVRETVPFFIATNNYSELKYIHIPKIINYLATFRFINEVLYSHHFFKNSNTLLNLYIKEIHKEIKKNFGDTKFVIFVYNNEGNENFQELENDGIIIIKSSDILKENLNDLKYKIYDKEHPNAKAWELVVPALAKELNLQTFD